MPDEGNKGWVLEVDLEYPDELHDLHDNLPLAPSRRVVNDSELSDYCEQIGEKLHVSSDKVEKLVPDLHNKEKYVLHYANLKQCLELGLKLTKVHRVLEFRHEPWLKPYIEKNTKLRACAKNAFEKDFFKLMNNSVFGKTMEQSEYTMNRLVHSEEKLLWLVAKPMYKCHMIFNEKLVAVHRVKSPLLPNKPAFVGMAILDLSKTLMYDFHYNYVKNKYGNNAKLLFTDTDSRTYEIKTEDLYKDFWGDKGQFDFSHYPREGRMSKFHSNDNKKVVGKFKDEACGEIITEFVGLRPKMYSYTKEDGSGDKKAKGVKKDVIKKNITHSDYLRVLEDEGVQYDMNLIRSNKHELGSYTYKKYHYRVMTTKGTYQIMAKIQGRMVIT